MRCRVCKRTMKFIGRWSEVRVFTCVNCKVATVKPDGKARRDL